MNLLLNPSGNKIQLILIIFPLKGINIFLYMRGFHQPILGNAASSPDAYSGRKGSSWINGRVLS